MPPNMQINKLYVDKTILVRKDLEYCPTDGCTSRWKIRERGKSGTMVWGNKDSAMV